MSDLPVHKRGERSRSVFPNMKQGFTYSEDLLYAYALAWDEINPTGEGFIPEPIRDDFQQIVDFGEPDIAPWIRYQWVRVTNDGGKVLGTFFLEQRDGVLVSMFLAAARKGLPPNPFEVHNGDDALKKWELEPKLPVVLMPPQSLEEVEERVRIRAEHLRLDPWPDEEDLTPEQVLEELQRLKNDLMREYHQRHDSRVPTAVNRSTSPWFRNGLAKSRENDHLQLTNAVVPVPSKDGDTRFKFRIGKDSFTVRGSKLAPVLLATRRANIQRIPVKTLRKALKVSGQ